MNLKFSLQVNKRSSCYFGYYITGVLQTSPHGDFEYVITFAKYLNFAIL